MNRSEYLHYKASDICDTWIEWFRGQGRDVDWMTLLDHIHAAWPEDALDCHAAGLYMWDMKLAILTYPGFWHPDDIVTGSADAIVWDIAYGMICNYLHEND